MKFRNTRWRIDTVAIAGVVLLMPLLIGGCATQQQLTREQWVDMTTRDYEGITKEQTLAAAEQLFRHADEGEFRSTHTTGELNATRRWTKHVVVGAAVGMDFWRVRTADIEGGVKVSVRVMTHSSAVSPSAAANSDWNVYASPTLGGEPMQGTAIYNLFWARMDHLLGQRLDWVDCRRAKEMVKGGIVWGSIEPLCNAFNVDDRRP